MILCILKGRPDIGCYIIAVKIEFYEDYLLVPQKLNEVFMS